MDNSDLIEKYLSKQMTKEEEINFLAEVDKNKELKSELNLRNDLNSFLEIKSERDNFKKQVKDILKNRKNNRVFNLSKSISIAASILLLVSFSFAAYFFTPEKNERLFNRYYKAYEFSPTERSSNEFVNDSETIAIEMYANKDYVKYIKQVDENNLLVKDDFIMHLVYASALIETNEIDKAITVLNGLLLKKNMYIETVQWYLALCYLQNEKRNKRKQQ
jgi:hypothetical protein